jgi:hypothetical protein
MGILKAQFWSFDVIFAVIIFSFAITILAFTWFNISNQLSLASGNGTGIMQLQLESLVQNLLTQGVPSNWQSTINTTAPSTWSSVSIGLASSQGSYVLSSSKLYTFMSIANGKNYQLTKQMLGVGFDYYITIKSNSDLGSGVDINIGRNPSTNGALTVYVDKLYASMNGVPVTVQVSLWTNTTLATS